MNRFDSNVKSSRPGMIKLLLLVLIAGVFLLVINYFINTSYLDDSNVLEEAIKRDVIHCYAVEGFYPPGVNYMEAHYGLNYDKDKYDIEYNYISGTIMPEYKVIKREVQ